VSFEEAFALFRAGRFAESEARLRAVVDAAPDRIEALELMGLALASQQRPGDALPWFERALALRPGSPGLRHNRAQALFALGRLDEARGEVERAVGERADFHAGWNLLGSVLAALGDAGAERAYRRALALRPDHADTHYNFGVLLQQLGRLDEAVASYRKALSLRPGFAAALNNLGNALRSLGRLDEAIPCYAQAVKADPGLADGHSNLGAALRDAGRVDEAIPVLERAVALAPRSWAALSNLGAAYCERSRFPEAIACHQRALAERPDFHEARGHLGNALAGLARWDEAEAAYREALEAAPEMPDVHSNLGLLLQERGDADGAMSHYRRALALRPDHADAINNLGVLLQERGEREEALALYRRALEANPRSARASYNLGLALLMNFHFAAGWPLCERRFDTAPPVAVRRALRQPVLSAADWGRRCTVAVWREQGVGDQLVYATLLPELERRGQAFIVEVDARLKPAFERAHPGWRVVGPEGSERAFEGCDRHIAIGSLPGLLRPSLESFAGQPPALLAADADRAMRYRAQLAAARDRIVGVSWRSFQPKTRGSVARRKSAPLDAWLPLGTREGLVLLDLQYGDTAAERENFARAGGRLARIEGLDLFNDLDGVLAAIEACDVVVTTSNVTAHLAGALGKRTLLVYLGDQPPFHYWARPPGGRCLWYPSVELVTGPEVATWPDALALVNDRLGA
jgi:tetratricopeptide (TPR) repeat protein